MGYGSDQNPVNLPPWLALPYFASPKTTYVTLPFSTPAIQLIGPDPMRWGLWFSCNANWFFGTDPALNTGSQSGLTLSQTIANVPIMYSQYGPLVNAAWYGISSGPATVTIISVSLLRWPTQEEVDGALDILPLPQRPPANKISTAPGVGGGRGLLDYWRRLIAKFGGK